MYDERNTKDHNCKHNCNTAIWSHFNKRALHVADGGWHLNHWSDNDATAPPLGKFVEFVRWLDLNPTDNYLPHVSIHYCLIIGSTSMAVVQDRGIVASDVEHTMHELKTNSTLNHLYNYYTTSW